MLRSCPRSGASSPSTPRAPLAREADADEPRQGSRRPQVMQAAEQRTRRQMPCSTGRATRNGLDYMEAGRARRGKTPLSVLRTAEKPLTVQQAAERVLTAKGPVLGPK